MEDTINAIGMPLIAALVPLVVAFIHRMLPRIPKPFLPILAAVVGPVVDQVLALIPTVDAIGWQAALLGLAGVGVREVVDQTTKSLKGTPS